MLLAIMITAVVMFFIGMCCGYNMLRSAILKKLAPILNQEEENWEDTRKLVNDLIKENKQLKKVRREKH